VNIAHQIMVVCYLHEACFHCGQIFCVQNHVGVARLKDVSEELAASLFQFEVKRGNTVTWYLTFRHCKYPEDFKWLVLSFVKVVI